MTINAVTVGIPTGYAGWKLLQTKSLKDFKAFSQDASLQRDIAYLKEKLPTKLTAEDLLSDRRLQTIVLTAYGLDGQVGYNGMMKKVLESNVSDSSSFAMLMTDYRFRQIAKDLNYGGISIPAIPAVPSSLSVQVEGVMAGQSFQSASGTFGGIKVSDVDLSGLTKRTDIAAALQAAFRKADKGSEDISVTALGMKLIFTDAKGRGTGTVSFTTDENSTPRAYLLEQTKGSTEIAASGGPKVTDSTTINSIVEKYTQARFESALGESSDTLRHAVYAKRMLPNVTNWYSVIADRNLADVVQTVLGLPSSFSSVDVDTQKEMLEKRMDIADFQDSTKLQKLLDRYVATASTQESAAAAASGAAALIQPISWGGNGFSGEAASALISILYSS